MKMGKTIWVAGAVALLSVPAVAAERVSAASRPAVVVRRCVERIQDLSERSVSIIAHHAIRSVRLIDHLQDIGQDDQAAIIAERSMASIEHLAKTAGDVIDRVARHCAEILAAMEAPQQAIDMVLRAGEAGRNAVESARDRAIQEIQDALNS